MERIFKSINFLSLGYPKIHALELRIRNYFFKRKLRRVALFIENHKLYPVTLNKELLEIWKKGL